MKHTYFQIHKSLCLITATLTIILCLLFLRTHQPEYTYSIQSFSNPASAHSILQVTVYRNSDDPALPDRIMKNLQDLHQGPWCSSLDLYLYRSSWLGKRDVSPYNVIHYTFDDYVPKSHQLKYVQKEASAEELQEIENFLQHMKERKDQKQALSPHDDIATFRSIK